MIEVNVHLKFSMQYFYLFQYCLRIECTYPASAPLARSSRAKIVPIDTTLSTEG